MSSFYTYDFVFDDVPSQAYDLKIITFEDGSLFNGVGSTSVNIFSQRVLRKSKPYYLGRTQETILEFPLTFGIARPISGMERDIISSWLFGRSGYKKLYILQDDLYGAYFNCFLNQPEPLYIGGVNYAFTCQVICDSPWAYLPEVTRTMGTTGETVSTIDIYNDSSEDDYLYPNLEIELEGYMYPFIYPMTVRVQNTNDDRSLQFVDIPEEYMTPGITINVNNDLQIVTATSGLATVPNILSYCNTRWFRLLPKLNVIQMNSSYATIAAVTITYTRRLKIGG